MPLEFQISSFIKFGGKKFFGIEGSLFGFFRKFNFLWNFQGKIVFLLFETKFYMKKYSFEAYFDAVAKFRKLKGGLQLDL